MSTLIYSPGIRIRIHTAHHGILDVTDDLSRGSLNLTENQESKLSITLANSRGKYNRVFTPNDRIVVHMKRVAWVQVFAGYLDSVPFMSAFPRDVPLTATCPLKRLKFTYWDPGAMASVSLLNGTDSGGLNKEATDAGISERLRRLLTEVGKVNKESIHIGALPSKWFERIDILQKKIEEETKVDMSYVSSGNAGGYLGSGATVGGQNLVGDLGRTTISTGIPYTGYLPAHEGIASWFGGPGGGAYNGMELTGEDGKAPVDPWYVAMRWPYKHYRDGRIRRVGTAEETRRAQAWWKNRKILVTNPANNKAVVLRAADWGPGGVPKADKRVIDMSKHALHMLGAVTDKTLLNIRFAKDTMALGPVSEPGSGVLIDRSEGPPSIADRFKVGGGGGAPAGSVAMPTGVRFESRDNLKPHVAAAREFILASWPQAKNNSMGGYSVRNVKGTSTPSDHSFGLALDAGNGAGGGKYNPPSPDKMAYSTSLAAWFVQNPNVFGVKYVIWNNQINSGKGWGILSKGRWTNDMNQGHYNHVHISFKNAAQGAPKSLGPAGGAWPGSEMPRNLFPEYAPLDSSGMTFGDGSGPLIGGGVGWEYSGSAASNELYGQHALMNDVPLLGSVRTIVSSSMRSFMSAPNGDFISWFPDYFGTYKTAGRINVRDIEIVGDGFTIMWDDSRLKTHMFATGSSVGYSNTGRAAPPTLYDQMSTAGIANVEFPEIMEALFNVSGAKLDKWAKDFLDGNKILDRYGARPESVMMGEISGRQAEFWLAISLFQQNWASQFSTTIPLTFMPEAYPGMLLYLESYGLQVYVTGVSHSFDFTSGFTTNVTVIAPSATDGSGLFGLPRADL